MNLNSLGNLLNCMNNRNVRRHKETTQESVNRGECGSDRSDRGFSDQPEWKALIAGI